MYTDSQTPSPEDLQRHLEAPSLLARGMASGKIWIDAREVQNGWLVAVERRAGLLSERKEYVAATDHDLVLLVTKVVTDLRVRAAEVES